MSEWLVLFRDVDVNPFIKAYDEADKTETDLTDRSTQGNKSKQYSIKYESIKPLALLFHKYIKKIQGVGDKNWRIGNAWCVEGDKGSYHRLHNHTIAKKDAEYLTGLACVLYVDVPQADDRGEFYYLIRDKDKTTLNVLMPNKGDLIIMPKTVYHGVYPQTSEGLRKTINIDFADE